MHRRLWWEAKGHRKRRQMVRIEALPDGANKNVAIDANGELKRCHQRQWRAKALPSVPMATLKCRDWYGLESLASPLSLIGDGLSFIGDG